MAQTAVGVDVFEALNVVCYQALKVAFDHVICVDDFAQFLFFSLGESFTRVVGSIFAAARMVEACFGPMP